MRNWLKFIIIPLLLLLLQSWMEMLSFLFFSRKIKKINWCPIISALNRKSAQLFHLLLFFIHFTSNFFFHEQLIIWLLLMMLMVIWIISYWLLFSTLVLSFAVFLFCSSFSFLDPPDNRHRQKSRTNRQIDINPD